jgi:hypothetical protein
MSFHIAFFRIKIIPQDDRLALLPPKVGVKKGRKISKCCPSTGSG